MRKRRDRIWQFWLYGRAIQLEISFECLIYRAGEHLVFVKGKSEWEWHCTWTRMMSAPASARAIAMDCPIPLVPPVTRAVCSLREKSC